MAHKIVVTVCVVALTKQDYGELDEAIKEKLDALGDVYDFQTVGKPYANSPDEWQPFEEGTPIRAYLDKANLKASLVSAQLYDPQRGAEVLKKTALYIIDPLVLTHTTKRERLAREIQTTIYNTEKAFCIVLPAELPAALRGELADVCINQLQSLHAIRDENDSYEWQVETAERLQSYLKRVARRLGPKADDFMLSLAQAVFAARGVARPDLSDNPQLVT